MFKTKRIYCADCQIEKHIFIETEMLHFNIIEAKYKQLFFNC